MKTTLFISLLVLSSTALAADLAKGKETYDRICSSCHGISGLGDGPVGAALPADQKPSNFQVAKFKYATDDAKMKEVIHKGGAAFGLSPLMAAQPQLSDSELNDVIAYVHSLKK